MLHCMGVRGIFVRVRGRVALKPIPSSGRHTNLARLCQITLANGLCSFIHHFLVLSRTHPVRNCGPPASSISLRSPQDLLVILLSLRSVDWQYIHLNPPHSLLLPQQLCSISSHGIFTRNNNNVTSRHTPLPPCRTRYVRHDLSEFALRYLDNSAAYSSPS